MLIIYSCCIRVLDLFIERMVAIRDTLNAATAVAGSGSGSGGSSNTGSPVAISPTVPQLEIPTIEAWNTSRIAGIF